MLRAPIVSRPRILAGGLCGLLAAALATAGAASAQASTAQASTAQASTARSGTAVAAVPRGVIRPGHWAQVTAPLPNNPLIPEIGLARGADGVLHVLWTTGSGPWHVKDTPIAATGKVGKSTTIATDFLATDPDVTTTPSGVVALWNGIKSNTPNSPQGTFTATRPPSGGSWSASGSAIAPLSAVPDTSSPDAAATGSDGKPWFAYSGTDSMVVDHVGHSEVQVAPSLKCCLDNAGLAVDGASGQTWLAYSSLIRSGQGIFARPLSATGKPSGPAVRLPRSLPSGGNIIPPEQRTAVTGRGHGRSGVFAVYGSGWPKFTSLQEIRLGTRSARTLAAFGRTQDMAGTAITDDQAGRLWVAWATGRGTSPGLFVRRSNPAAGTFGPAERVALPGGTTAVLKVYINARGGALDVVALIDRGNLNQTSYWATEVLAPLALSATRTSSGGAEVTIRVTDAGTAVQGATVRFCGKHFTTPKSGRVTFRVASVSHGSATATATKAGYAGASLKVKATC
jgi:hypothetical protein